tara:strand:+ start:2256 stop:2591 length:336 start_codon:yes stop_codon:yes gene_type:complete
MSRFSDREVLINDLEFYKSILKRRAKKTAFIYETAELSHPTQEQISTLSLEPHRWTVGDRFFKLAREYYGDPTLWWVIAHFNKMPTEGHVELGDMIYIPLPVGRVVRMLEG